MSRDQQKPPWLNIMWYETSPKPFSSSQVKLGVWKEDPNEEIESLKESIRPYDQSALWDLAKRITNPYELISTFSSRLHLPKSTCLLHPLSRSFFKMIEILKHLNFFERHSKVARLKSLHICEGPGGFIEAFLNRAEKARARVHTAYGMTLKSTNAIIPGWRRAQQFLQKNPNVQLLYGATGTGDVYEPVNQDWLAETLKGGVHFVTADGGFDFSEDFHAQEKSVLRLIVNSAIIILRTLAPEGDCVLKVFDLQSRVSRDIVYLLSTCFQSWTLYKPVTSRPCNSEWYFLGRSALRDRTTVLQILTQIRDSLAESKELEQLVDVNPIEEMLRQLQTARVERQDQALRHVLEFCKTYEESKCQDLWNKNRNLTVRWCYDFGMPTEFKLP